MRATLTLGCSIILGACVADGDVHGDAFADRTSALTAAQLTSVHGTYGAGCTDRSGGWSVALAGEALPEPPLAVVANNTSCELTVTEVVAGQRYSLVPPLTLTTGYQGVASALVKNDAQWLVNAKLDSTTFASDFTLTLLVSGDPVLGSGSSTARYIYQTEVVRDAPLSYWRLGDTGSTAVDVMARSHGTYQAVTLGVTGALTHNTDRAADFTITTSRVEVPHVLAYDVASQFTIEAWVRPDTVSGTRGILDNGGSSFLYINNGELVFGFKTLLGSPTIRAPITAGASWQHVVGTYNGSTLVLYRNGTAVNSGGASGSSLPTLAALRIGTTTTSGSSFDGALDEVALYGVALSPTQVATHHARGAQ